MPASRFKSFCSILSISSVALVFLAAPLKLGSVVGSSGIGFFPLALVDWIFSPWPPFTAPIITGCALLFALLSGRSLSTTEFFRFKHFILPSVFLLVASLVGLIKTTEWDNASLYVWHIVAVLNFVLVVLILVKSSDFCRKLFLACLALGTVLSLFSGLYQVRYGFDETREFVLQKAETENRKISPELNSRLSQRRAYATFTYPNSFAAYLILTIPLTLAVVSKFGSRFTPAIGSQIFFTSIFGVTSIIMLGYTGSRSAVLALALAGIATGITGAGILTSLVGKSRTRFWLSCSGITIVIFLLALSVFHGRTFSSVDARFGYYRAAIEMFRSHPFLGVGLGEFFPFYMRLKPPGAEETRLAHNLFLHFLSQCGLFGGIAAGYFLLQPLIIWRCVIRDRISTVSPLLFYAGFMGCVAWGIHSLTDFNFHITGMVLAVSTLLPLTTRLPVSEESDRMYKSSAPISCMLLILALVGITSAWRGPGERSFQILYNRVQVPVDLNVIESLAVATAEKLPYSPYPWEFLGKTALVRGDYTTAKSAFAEAAKRVPHRASNYAYLAQCSFTMGSAREAMHWINQALKWYPHHPEFQRLRGVIGAALKGK